MPDLLNIGIVFIVALTVVLGIIVIRGLWGAPNRRSCQSCNGLSSNSSSTRRPLRYCG